MARGLVATISPRHNFTSITTTSFSRVSLINRRISILSLFLRLSPAIQCFCKISVTAFDISSHREAFAKRMAMAGLNPHHRIALGVSGGPDSIALCLLTAHWKANSACDSDSNGYIDGLLAIIVDHGLRTESRDEAKMVSSRVSKLGIRCEIATGDWSNGRPKQGHLQEAARDLRYGIFQEVCVRNQIGVLLIAHHADDQAELFILRLSRNSGVLGLAGMAFTSRLYSALPLSYEDSSKNQGIILVRPLLDLTKEDLYEICKEGNQEWVEDPTNSSQLYARNRIRTTLYNETSRLLNYELQRLISTCRRVRTYVDSVSHTMINHTVRIMDNGYAIIDLKLLDPSNREEICLSKFLASILQFISQRNKPVRGSTSKLLIDYVRTYPCKASLTAAGCYLCPAPGTKGTKVLVCCSVESILASNMEFYTKYLYIGHKQFIPHEVEKNTMEGRCYMEQLVLDPSDKSFLNEFSSDSLLYEARKLNILSEPTYRSIIEMKMCEADHFKSSNIVISSNKTKQIGESDTPYSNLFRPGQSCYFMNRFIVTWSSSNMEVGGRGQHYLECSLCANGNEIAANVRHMIEEDWLYLAQLSKWKKPNAQHYVEESFMETTFSDYAVLSAKQALASLKSIPVAARRALPVLVSPQGLLLSIPSVEFKLCPCLLVSVEFKPRVPLSGGHSSFV
ncbi:hypothetical protein V2J09_000123 [Rumex salicifolius]